MEQSKAQELGDLLNERLGMSHAVGIAGAAGILNLIKSADKLEEGFIETLTKLINAFRHTMAGGDMSAKAPSDPAYFSRLDGGPEDVQVILPERPDKGLQIRTNNVDSSHILTFIGNGGGWGMSYRAEGAGYEPDIRKTYNAGFTYEDVQAFSEDTLDDMGRNAFQVVRGMIEAALEEADVGK